jgi:glycosyltransferase involved in cell wall biosynthesis
MRLAVYHNQPSGGARRALHGFCRELSSRHEVDIYTLESSDRSLPDEVSGRVLRLPYAPRPAIRGGLYLNDLRRRWDLRDLEAVNRTAAGLIDAGDYDVVLADACRFTYAPAVLAHLRTPSVYYCHHGPWRAGKPSLRPPLSNYERARRLWHRPFEAGHETALVRLDRTLARAAGAVVTNSDYTAGRIGQEYGLEARVCPPGIDLPARPARDDGDYLLSIGAIEHHKGFDFLVDALARLPAAGRPPLRLVANEANPLVLARLEAQAERSQVRLQVTVGASEDELWTAYRGALGFVYAAHDEPLGLAPLEAMAHGLAVLAVAEGGPSLTISDGRTGLLSPRDTAAFAARLEEVVGKPSLRRRLARAARAEIAAEWSWPARARLLEQVLDEASVHRASEVAV